MYGIIRIPVALRNFGQEQDPYFVPDFARGLAAALHREKQGGNGGGKNTLPKVTEGENSPGVLFLGPIAFPCASFYHRSSPFFFFPFPMLAPAVSIPSTASVQAVKHPDWLNILK